MARYDYKCSSCGNVFEVIQSVGGLRAPVLALVVAVNGFLAQHLRNSDLPALC